MNSDPRLIERSAEKQAQSEFEPSHDNELVVEFELDIESEGQINYKNLDVNKQKTL